MPTRVQDVMTTEVVIAYPTTPVKQVAGLLNQHRLSALPVTDGQGRVLSALPRRTCSATASGSRTGSRPPRLVR